MRHVIILNSDDLVGPSDFCRPLDETGERVNDTNQYGGKLINNLRWIKVSEVYGECHFGKTVSVMNEKATPGFVNAHPMMEFARGCFEDHHCISNRDLKDACDVREIY